jgi:hypothetical protein
VVDSKPTEAFLKTLRRQNEMRHTPLPSLALLLSQACADPQGGASGPPRAVEDLLSDAGSEVDTGTEVDADAESDVDVGSEVDSELEVDAVAPPPCEELDLLRYRSGPDRVLSRIDGALGGEVVSDDGSLTLRFQPGAFAGQVEIAIEPLVFPEDHPLGSAYAAFARHPSGLALNGEAELRWRSAEPIVEYDRRGVIRVANRTRNPLAWLAGVSLIHRSPDGAWSIPGAGRADLPEVRWAPRGEAVELRASLTELGAVVLHPAYTETAIELPGGPWDPVTVEVIARVGALGPTDGIVAVPSSDGVLRLLSAAVEADGSGDGPLGSRFFRVTAEFACLEAGTGTYGFFFADRFDGATKPIADAACLGLASEEALAVLGLAAGGPPQLLALEGGGVVFSDGARTAVGFAGLTQRLHCPAE